METVFNQGPEVDLNVLMTPKSEREHGEHGWFAGAGEHNYDYLLKETVVKEWIDAYTAESTRRHKLYQFKAVLEASRLKDPAELLKLNDAQAKSLVKRVAQFYLQKGKPTWARQLVITMRSFYEAHDRELKFKRAERIRTPASKKIGVQVIPAKADIFRMADLSGSLRNRAMLLCMFQSGVRVGCLCNWTYGVVEKQLFPEIKLPVQIRVTPDMDHKLNSYGLSYYVTFLGEESAQALKSYIEQRKEKGWQPRAKDLLFVTEGTASQGGPLSPTGVWEIVKRSAGLADLDAAGVWTHTIRKAFRRVLNATPQIDEDSKEALMGHKLPGSRGSYFDYHDLDEIAAKYQEADFARNNSNGGKRLTALEARNEQLADALKNVAAELAQLRHKVEEGGADKH